MYIAQKKYKTAQLGHTAGEVEVQPLSPYLTLPLNSNPPTNVLCVLCCTCVYRHFSNANSWSYSLWL